MSNIYYHPISTIASDSNSVLPEQNGSPPSRNESDALTTPTPSTSSALTVGESIVVGLQPPSATVPYANDGGATVQEAVDDDEESTTLNPIPNANANYDEDEGITPDQVLDKFGPWNRYLLFIWLAMGAVWGLNAMPMMVSAFLMGSCAPDGAAHNCTPKDGSLAKEFDLTGDRAKLLDYMTSVFLIGVNVGSVFIPALSDRKGRRPVVVLCLCLVGVFGCFAAMAPSIYAFILLRFLQGTFFTGCGVTNWVLAYESIAQPLRAYTALTFGLWWVVGYFAVGPLAYYLDNWRWLMASVSAPAIVTGVVYYFTIPESFHYVVSRRSPTEVTRWIERANFFADRVNGDRIRASAPELCDALQRAKRLKFVTIENDAVDALATSGALDAVDGATNGASLTIKTEREKNLLQHLAGNRVLFLYTFVMVYLWTCDTFVYYGLSLYSARLAGDEYLNFALMALIEVPSYLISPLLLNALGRRCFVSLCHFLAAISFFIIIFNQANAVVHMAMWLLGKFAISCAFTCLFVYASELFPTVVRNGCIGVCTVIAGVGGALAPTVQAMANISPVIPTVFFGVCAMFGGALTLILPETRNRELPDSPQQIT